METMLGDRGAHQGHLRDLVALGLTHHKDGIAGQDRRAGGARRVPVVHAPIPLVRWHAGFPECCPKRVSRSLIRARRVAFSVRRRVTSARNSRSRWAQVS